MGERIELRNAPPIPGHYRKIFYGVVRWEAWVVQDSDNPNIVHGKETVALTRWGWLAILAIFVGLGRIAYYRLHDLF